MNVKIDPSETMRCLGHMLKGKLRDKFDKGDNRESEMLASRNLLFSCCTILIIFHISFIFLMFSFIHK